MKKFLLLVVAVMLGFGTVSAKSVDVNTARTFGQKFVYANFEQVSTTDLQLVATVTSDNGDNCFYVFNVGENGFVIISASDNYHPILAYSEESNFDMGNEHNGAMFMLENFRLDIANAISKDYAPMPEVAAEWAMLEKTGRLNAKKAEKVGPICTTKWNQDSPYNLYAPADAHGPGGRAYAGCAATAMSQIMKFWNAPLHGEGSHSYYTKTHHHHLSVDFSSATYEWDKMPTTLNNATQEQIEAVALLMYHCGVAVDMDYDGEKGSGAYSEDVPDAMRNYFDYDYCVRKMRQSYATDVWNQMLRDEFDLGRPVYYSGQSSSGGHAFVCDGYDENDLMHFNFGWSGSDDGWYLVDEIDYTGSAGAIFNYVPTNVYENTVQAPTNLTVTRASETAQSATLTWKNPSKTMSDVAVSAIDAMVVERNGQVIATLDAQVGADMTYVDENVPCYSTFTYTIYAMKDGVRGNYAEASEQFGPTKTWKLILTASSMQGWRGGSIKCFDAANNMFNKVTMTNSTPATLNVEVPFGHDVYFVWKKGASTDGNMSVKIKDENNNVVYEYSGSMADLAEGVIFKTKNNGNGTPSAAVPSNINAEMVGDDIVVTWSGEMAQYGFNVYRNEELYALVHDNTFTDIAPEIGGYCYYVCNFGTDGESASTYDACASAGEGCNPATELWYYAQDNLKPVITWTKPVETTQSLSGYYIMRRDGDEGEYKQVKILGPNKVEYKESSSLELGTYYSYKVIAYYQDIDCKSAPAKAKYGNEFFVRYHYSQEGVEENAASTINVYPNPAKDVLTVKAGNISSVSIYSLLGQRVYSEDVNSDEAVINMSDLDAGMYVVRVVADGTEMVKKISVIR